MTSDEIKLRQMTNQYLITPSDKLTVVRGLLGAQAQFMANAIHSLKIRCNDFHSETVADGLVKNWSVRGTVHVFAESDLALFKHENSIHNHLSEEWKGYVYFRSSEWTLTPERQKYFSRVILESLKESTHTREELKEICVSYGMTQPELDSMFDQWGGGIRELCERGFMCYIVQEKKAFGLCPPFVPMNSDEAQLEMARRYFTNVAPATIRDAAYFFHTTQVQVKKWLDKLPVTSAECSGKTYFYIENGNSYNKDIPDCILIAGFDQLMLGYQKAESLYLPSEHLRGIFNLAGIVMPAILLRGKVIGKWQKKGTKLTFTLFECIREDDKKIIAGSAECLWDDMKKIEWK
ncbi:MAG: DNA glycosylase AlkZ-like family protein [Eubacteriales bacterium]